MGRSRFGFSLLEVLMALLVITVALLGMAGTLGPVARLAGEGRARGRAAQMLASRLDRLRAELLAAAPACAAPASGSAWHPNGFYESWSSGALAGRVEVSIITLTPRPGGAVADTIRTRLACP
jgi:prepilin-type N-terminal cleavage/methylation domain-containing protein